MLQRQMLTCQGWAILKNLWAASHQFFLVEAWAALLSPPPPHWKRQRGAYEGLLYRITRAGAIPEPCSWGGSCQMSQGAGGLAPYRSSWEGCVQTTRTMWANWFHLWAYPIDRRWLPGTSYCSLAPWSNSDVCYGQRMKEGCIYAMCLNLTLDRIKSPLPFSHAPSPQRMCSDLAKIMCQTLSDALFVLAHLICPKQW